MKIEKLRWVTLALQVLIAVATDVQYELSVLMVPLEKERGWAIPVVALAFTLTFWVGPFGNFIGGYMRDKLGERKSILLGGLVYGLFLTASAFAPNAYVFILLWGMGAALGVYIIYVSSVSNVGALFPERRGLALGIYLGAATAGLAVLAPIVEALASATNARAAIIILGVSSIVVVPVAALFLVIAPVGYHPSRGRDADESEPVRAPHTLGAQISPLRMIRTPLFWVFAGSIIVTSVASLVFQSTGPVIGEVALGLDSATAALVISVFSLTSTVGAVFNGVIADKLGGWAGLFFVAVVATVACVALVVSRVDSAWIFFAASALLGLTYGAVTVMIPQIVMNSFGEKYFGRNLATISLSTLPPALIAPQIAVNLDAPMAFTICLVLSALGVPLALGVRQATRRLAGSAAKYQPVDPGGGTTASTA